MDKADSMDSGCVPDFNSSGYMDNVTTLLENEYNFSLSNLNPLGSLKTSHKGGLNRRKEEQNLQDHITNNTEDHKIKKQNIKHSKLEVESKPNKIRNILIPKEREQQAPKQKGKTNEEKLAFCHRASDDRLGIGNRKIKEIDKNARGFESKQSRPHKKHDHAVNGEIDEINGNIMEFESKHIKKHKKYIQNENAINSETKQSKTHTKHDQDINGEINEMNGSIMEFESKQTKKNKKYKQTENAKIYGLNETKKINKFDENAIDSETKQSKTHTKHNQAINGEINGINGNIMEFQSKQIKKNKYKQTQNAKIYGLNETKKINKIDENAIDSEAKQGRAHANHDQVVNGEINEINRNIREFESKQTKKNKKYKQTENVKIDEINENRSKFVSTQSSPISKHVQFENEEINQIDKSTQEFESKQSINTKRKHEEINGLDENEVELKNKQSKKSNKSASQGGKLVSIMSESQLMTEKSSVEEKLEKLARVTSGNWFNQAHQLRRQLRLRLRIINKYLYPDLYVNPILDLARIKVREKEKKMQTSQQRPMKQLATKETVEDLKKARHNMHIKIQELKKNIMKDTRPENVQKLMIKLKSGIKTLDSRINKGKKKSAANKAREEVTAEKLLEMIDNIKSPPNFSKPVYNQHGKLVYSKFDLANPLKDTLDNNKTKDLKASLVKVLKEKEEINQLKREGKVAEAVEQLDQSLWKNSLKRIAGEKVKDDPAKLQDSIKRIEKAKQKSAVQWAQREQFVANRQRQIQERKNRNKAKRTERREAKKKHKQAKWKVKSCVSVPGF